MTVVVADTSPINYLLLIGEINLLPRLYGEVVLPFEVVAELSDKDAPPEVSRWIGAAPDWIRVRHPRASEDDPVLPRIGPGERAAILLAHHESDVLLLIDDAAGRAEANKLGIPNIGTLGILRAGARRRLLSLPTALERLAETNFRVSQRLLADLLEEDSMRSRHVDEREPDS
jgi:predicted nucleic acid-binding protein